MHSDDLTPDGGKPRADPGLPEGAGPRDDVIDESNLLPNAKKVAVGLRIASVVLSVPAMAVMAGAFIGFTWHGVLAVGRLVDEVTVPRVIWLAAVLAGIALVVVFLFRVVVTTRAARDSEVLAAELVGMADVRTIATAALADLAAVTATDGGLQAVSRARALWRLLRVLDVSDHVSAFKRARWFVPPEVSTTWLIAQWVTWGGLAAWLVAPVLTGGVFAGWF